MARTRAAKRHVFAERHQVVLVVGCREGAARDRSRPASCGTPRHRRRTAPSDHRRPRRGLGDRGQRAAAPGPEARASRFRARSPGRAHGGRRRGGERRAALDEERRAVGIPFQVLRRIGLDQAHAPGGPVSGASGARQARADPEAETTAAAPPQRATGSARPRDRSRAGQRARQRQRQHRQPVRPDQAGQPAPPACRPRHRPGIAQGNPVSTWRAPVPPPPAPRPAPPPRRPRRRRRQRASRRPQPPRTAPGPPAMQHQREGRHPAVARRYRPGTARTIQSSASAK